LTSQLQEAIDALATEYAPILKQLGSYDERQGYMTAELVSMKDIIGDWTFNSVRLYAGYVAASYERNAPDESAAIREAIANLI
jgi:hypothetical protein